MKVIPIELFNKWCEDKQYHELYNGVTIMCYKRFVTTHTGKKFTAMFAYDNVNDIYYRIIRIHSDKYYGIVTESDYQDNFKSNQDLMSRRKYYDPTKVKY